ncbi:MAG: ABC transporter permease [Spirochaetales bacterium]|nr:ABC transporter permease [Spirochaetales bacterium]
MTIRDRLWMTFRHLQVSLIGSILVILAIAIGVALAAATTAFIIQYNQQSEELLNHPIYREVYVEALGDPRTETELQLPVVEMEGNLKDAKLLSVTDLPLVLQSVPGLTHAYIAEGIKFRSTSYLMESGLGEAAVKGIAAMRETRAAAAAKSGVDPENPKATGEVMGGTKGGALGGAPGGAMGGETGAFVLDLKDVTEIPVDEFFGIFATPDFFTAYTLNAASGSLFTEEDLKAGNQVMILGSNLAETLFPDGNAIGSRISVNWQTFTILGILEPSDIVAPQNGYALNDFAFAPHFLFAGAAFGKNIRGQGLPTLRFAVEDSDDIQQAVIQLEEFLKQEYPNVNLRVTAAVDKLETERQKLSRILIVLIFLTAAGLFIAAINMFNLLLIRVIKQTKGIGVLRALGFTRDNVLQHFLFESFIMSLAGAVIGLAASPFLFRFLQSALVSGIEQGSSTFFLDLLLGAAIAFVFSIVFGLYPAYVARQTETSTALRAE